MHGVVLGALQPDGTVDVDFTEAYGALCGVAACGSAGVPEADAWSNARQRAEDKARRLVATARPMRVTFHRSDAGRACAAVARPPPPDVWAPACRTYVALHGGAGQST